MKTPHTSAPRGKRVCLHMRDGRKVIGKFVERTGKFIVLDCGRFRGIDIAQMSIVGRAAAEALTA